MNKVDYDRSSSSESLNVSSSSNNIVHDDRSSSESVCLPINNAIDPRLIPSFVGTDLSKSDVTKLDWVTEHLQSEMNELYP